MARRYASKKRYVPKRKYAPKRSVSYGAQAINMIKGYALAKLKQKLGLNTEQKYVDNSGVVTCTGTLALKIQPPVIVQGSAVDERNGAGVRITKVEQRLSILADAAATNGCNLRVITVRHLHGGNPSVADILQQPSDITSQLHNNLKANHIELISDRVYPVSTALAGNPATYVNNTYSRANWQLEWTDADTTGAVANIINGGISTLMMIDNVTTSPDITYTQRYWYVDN